MANVGKQLQTLIDIAIGEGTNPNEASAAALNAIRMMKKYGLVLVKRSHLEELFTAIGCSGEAISMKGAIERAKRNRDAANRPAAGGGSPMGRFDFGAQPGPVPKPGHSAEFWREYFRSTGFVDDGGPFRAPPRDPSARVRTRTGHETAEERYQREEAARRQRDSGFRPKGCIVLTCEGDALRCMSCGCAIFRGNTYYVTLTGEPWCTGHPESAT